MNRKLLWLGIGMLMVTSCTKEPEIAVPEKSATSTIQLSEAEMERLPLLSDNHRRTPETVLAFAEKYLQAIQPATKTAISLSISDSVLFTGVATKGPGLKAAPIYVVEQDNKKGFILVAGDNRIPPVLGFVEEGDYTEGDNPNFDFMMGRLQEEVLAVIAVKESLRDSIYDNLRIKLGLSSAPGTKGDGDGLVPDPPGAPDLDVPDNFDRMEVVERDTYYEIEYQYGPLLKTKWGQWPPYNSEIVKTHPGCPTGCAATAIAQIMAYYRHPTYMAATGHTYLWDQFPNNSMIWSGDAHTSIGYLMADLGLSPYLNISYKPSGSTASHKTFQRTFEAFGYTVKSSWYSYSYDPVFSEVSAGRPVQVIGDDNKSLGHAWVLDGVFQQNTFVTYYALFYLGDKMIREIKGASAMIATAHTVHHNFGWTGSEDGWFISLDPMYFKPSIIKPSDINHNMEIMIGIQPK